MANPVGIQIKCIAQTQLNVEECDEWLESLGVSLETRVKLLETPGVTDAASLIRLAGKRCYMAFEVGLNPNISKVREDISKYIDHILESGHGSVLEHVTYSFAIEGLSRVCTAELNRHRAGVAISEGSMRYIRFKDLPYYMPPSIEPHPDDSPELYRKKLRTRENFQAAFQNAESIYAELEDIWADELAPDSKFALKKQITSMMRRIVPIGVATGGIWTFNLRSLRHVCTMRCDESAEEEINVLAVKLLDHMLLSELQFFRDFNRNAKGFYEPRHRKV